MKKKGAILVLGFIVILSGWWVVEIDSRAQPTAGVLDVWTTWVDAPGQLQALLDRYSQVSDMPIRVKTGVKGSQVTKAMAGPFPPDIIVLSSNDLVWSYYAQGLIEPLDAWIEGACIDLDDFCPAPLAQCETPDGTMLCLPWGCDVDSLFWNKDLIQAAGLDPERPPQTMEELVAYADQLTVRDEEGELSQMGPDHIPRLRPDLDYGVTPFPPPVEHRGRAHTAVAQGAVIVIPAGARDMKVAAGLMAWMTSPEIVVEMAYIDTSLPTSRRAAQDPRFQQIPHFQVFMDLLDHPTGYMVATPTSAEVN
jgi:ABC-type glycerol-3-phosphate transport system substrate-binding protein